MIKQLAINLNAFDSRKVDEELVFLERSFSIDLNALFLKACQMLARFNLTPIQQVPMQFVREHICADKRLDENIECYYWNNLSANVGMSDLQFKEKIRESLIHHIRLLYVDLWDLTAYRGIPLDRMFQLKPLPVGALLDVGTA